MNNETIGKKIAALRKERGITQEKLAEYAGVSTQAVSKWENGGIPDTELLPKIADFFNISLDSLFGRELSDYSDLKTTLNRYIAETPPEKKFKTAFDFCWDIERSLYGIMPKNFRDSDLEDLAQDSDKNVQIYSSMLFDTGFTRMGVTNPMQYFLLVPEAENTEEAFLNNVDYVSFFRDFSDPDVFGACVLLFRRKADKAFTPNLLVKDMKLDLEKSKSVIETLKKYDLISKTEIELDDDTQTVYNFKPSPSFIALLIFAKEMIKSPNHFNHYIRDRSKPYLHG